MYRRSRKNYNVNVIHRITSETIRLSEMELKPDNKSKSSEVSSLQQSRKNPSGSFQITSVCLTGRFDPGDDSADDLDESRTDELSRLDNETPSYSEDTYSRDGDECYQLGHCIMSSPGAIPKSVVPSVSPVPTTSTATTAVSNTVTTTATSPSRKVGDRFKVVKIESCIPFFRGRWRCLDYVDHSKHTPQDGWVYCDNQYVKLSSMKSPYTQATTTSTTTTQVTTTRSSQLVCQFTASSRAPDNTNQHLNPTASSFYQRQISAPEPGYMVYPSQQFVYGQTGQSQLAPPQTTQYQYSTAYDEWLQYGSHPVTCQQQWSYQPQVSQNQQQFAAGTQQDVQHVMTSQPQQIQHMLVQQQCLQPQQPTMTLKQHTPVCQEQMPIHSEQQQMLSQRQMGQAILNQQIPLCQQQQWPLQEEMQQLIEQEKQQGSPQQQTPVSQQQGIWITPQVPFSQEQRPIHPQHHQQGWAVQKQSPFKEQQQTPKEIAPANQQQRVQQRQMPTPQEPLRLEQIPEQQASNKSQPLQQNLQDQPTHIKKQLVQQEQDSKPKQDVKEERDNKQDLRRQISLPQQQTPEENADDRKEKKKPVPKMNTKEHERKQTKDYSDELVSNLKKLVQDVEQKCIFSVPSTPTTIPSKVQKRKSSSPNFEPISGKMMPSYSQVVTMTSEGGWQSIQVVFNGPGSNNEVPPMPVPPPAASTRLERQVSAPPSVGATTIQVVQPAKTDATEGNQGMSVDGAADLVGDEAGASGASGASTAAIDSKIEKAMDLVKSHLLYTVREEVEVLKERIAELVDRINQLELENNYLRANASPEVLYALNSGAAAQQQQQQQPPTSGQN